MKSKVTPEDYNQFPRISEEEKAALRNRFKPEPIPKRSKLRLRSKKLNLPDRQCPNCGKQLERGTTEQPHVWRKRVYCNHSCAAHYQHAHATRAHRTVVRPDDYLGREPEEQGQSIY